MQTKRIESFSDGIFAIATTLLVLGIRVPMVEDANLMNSLIALSPNFLAFVLSFLIICVYWVGHHTMFYYIKSVDRTLLWLNNFFLLFVVFLPFSASLLGEYPFNNLSLTVYGINLIFINLSSTLFWIYSTAKHRLVEKNLPYSFCRNVTIIHSLPIVVYFVAIILSTLNIIISYVIFILVPLFFVIPNPLINKLLGQSPV